MLIDINLWYQNIVAMILESQDDSNFDDIRQTTYPVATRPLIATQRDYAYATALWTFIGIEGGAAATAQTLLTH